MLINGDKQEKFHILMTNLLPIGSRLQVIYFIKSKYKIEKEILNAKSTEKSMECNYEYV